MVDLGLAAKVRPCLVISVPAGETERSLVTLVPHTTALRGSQYECSVPTPFLKAGAFDAQNLITVPNAKMMRCLGALKADQVGTVETVLRQWLGLTSV